MSFFLRTIGLFIILISGILQAADTGAVEFSKKNPPLFTLYQTEIFTVGNGNFQPKVYYEVSGKALNFDPSKVKAYYSLYPDDKDLWIEMPLNSSETKDKAFFVLEGCKYTKEASRYVCNFYWRQAEWLCWSGGFGSGCNNILAGFGMPFHIKFVYDDTKQFYIRDVHKCLPDADKLSKEKYTTELGLLNMQMKDGKGLFCQGKPVYGKPDEFSGTGINGWCQYGMKKNNNGLCSECDAGRKSVTNGLGWYVCVKECPAGQTNSVELTNIDIEANMDTVKFLNQSFAQTKGFKNYDNLDSLDKIDKCESSSIAIFSSYKDANGPAVPVGSGQNDLKDELICESKTYYQYNHTTGKCDLKCPTNMVKTADGKSCEEKKADECKELGAFWKYNSSDNSCVCVYSGADVNNNCECPKGTVAEFVGGKHVCSIVPDDKKGCSADLDCKENELCKDGTCVLNGPVVLKHFGESCTSNDECSPDEHLACSSGTCYCDSANKYYLNNLTAKCEFNGGSPLPITCEDKGGEEIDETCLYNKDQIACLKKGNSWSNGSCLEPVDPPTPAGKGGCGNNISASDIPQNVTSIIPYLLVLVPLRFGRNRTKR